ncbi:MAG: DMT family transporter [Pseudomonadota bacterium]|nr:DMT family transporter [Pseudomonadota bacterium]
MFPIILLIASCILFSILAALIKFNSQFVHPIEQAFFRNFISIFFLIPFILKEKIFIRKKSNVKLLILRGLFGGITMVLLFCSYTMIPLSQAMAVSFSTPLFIYLGGIVFFKERTSKFNNFMMFIGFFLTLAIIRPDLELKLGTIFALTAAITHAIAGLLVKKVSQTESIIVLMLSMVLLMTPLTFFPSLYVWTTPQNGYIFLLLFVVAIVATLGNYFWTKALSISKLTNLMSFDFSKLIFTTILGLIFFNERLDYVTLICGGGLIICNNLTAINLKKNENQKNLLSNN